MDPRRARDPRLARADPRLQQPQPQQPQQQRQPIPAQIPNNGINSNPGSHSVTPPQPFVTAIATVSSQIPPPADPSTSALTHSSDTPSPARFKTRPLFCVVCASNQVRGSNVKGRTQLLRRTHCRTGPWRDTSSCSAHLSLYIREELPDLSKESWVSRYFVRHWVSCSITWIINRQAQHLPFWHTVRGYFPRTSGKRSPLVRPVQKWCERRMLTDDGSPGILRMGYYKCWIEIGTSNAPQKDGRTARRWRIL
jgi:hypothetical protein